MEALFVTVDLVLQERRDYMDTGTILVVITSLFSCHILQTVQVTFRLIVKEKFVLSEAQNWMLLFQTVDLVLQGHRDYL